MKYLIQIIVFTVLFSTHLFSQKLKYAVVVSANMEWKAVKKFYPNTEYKSSPWGEYFFKKINNNKVLFFHQGWGKVAAAGATQYVIDEFNPKILINLGTCGGFEGEVERLDIILANKTVIYDITEAMGDSKEAIKDYSTDIDLSWLGNKYPGKVIKTVLVSADKDLRPDEIEFLRKEYGAVAGDWESGAIAYTANKNNVKILILRGVSDLVSTHKAEAYGNFELFAQKAEEVMFKLLKQLPSWIEIIGDR